MASPKNTHVPKYGNWDSEDIAYTTYFENACKGKVTGSKMFNPNDPDENPNAFKSGIFAQGYEPRKKQYEPKKQQYEDESFDNYVMVNNHSTERLNGEGQDRFLRYMEAPVHYHSENFDSYISGHPKSSNTKSDINKSNSEYSLLHSQHRNAARKYTDEANYGLSPTAPKVIPKTANVRQGEVLHQKTVSVPKYSTRSSMNRKSGKVAATSMPSVPSNPARHQVKPRKPKNSTWSKMSCCQATTAVSVVSKQ